MGSNYDHFKEYCIKKIIDKISMYVNYIFHKLKKIFY